MRAFLDANVLFSAAYRVESPLLGLWAVHDVDVELVTSQYAVHGGPHATDVPRLDPQTQRMTDALSGEESGAEANPARTRRLLSSVPDPCVT